VCERVFKKRVCAYVHIRESLSPPLIYLLVVTERQSVCVRECLQSVCVRMYIFGSPSHQSKSSLSHMCVREGERDSEGKRVCVRERVHLYIFENPCPRH